MTSSYELALLTSALCGLLIGIERGWRQRAMADGTRVAGVRTFTLIGGIGGLIAVIASTLSAILAAVIAVGVIAALLFAFLRGRLSSSERDATTMMAAFATLLLGIMAGAMQPQLAIAGAALCTLVLASRERSHRFLHALSPDELQSLALFAVISVAVLPFLPDREFGPYSAWNPFKLWLVVVLIVGFSALGYIANKAIGARRGTLAVAVIGGAYSSTAVTAAMSAQLGKGQAGPFSTGIAVASAVMYLRVLLLAAILARFAALELCLLLSPATLTAWVAVAISWRAERRHPEETDREIGKPFRLAPAAWFALAVAGASLLVRWAQVTFGQAGAGWALFLAGSFDVDAATVALSRLPPNAIAAEIAAFALAGTVAVNMAFKISVVFTNAGSTVGRRALLALLASQLALLATLGLRSVQLLQ